MVQVYIKTVNGGEDTTPAGTDAIELDDGTTSRWALLSNLYKAIGSGTQDATTFLRGDGTYASVGAYFTNAPDGTMLNGKIAPTVSADDLVLTLQTLAGNNPSASEPVWIKINGVWRSVTAALSVTAADGTNWANLGGAERGTKEVDLFPYLGYNATDGVVIGWSPIPYAAIYSDFSTTNTNDRYCRISTITNAAAGDNYVLIGRFAATLSLVGTGHLWTVPTYTTKNLIQRPIYETRWLDYQPAYSAGGSMTYTSVTTTAAKYKLVLDTAIVAVNCTGTTGGVADTDVYFTAPFSRLLTTAYDVFGYGVGYDAATIFPAMQWNNTSTTLVRIQKIGGNWNLAAAKSVQCEGRYIIG